MVAPFTIPKIGNLFFNAQVTNEELDKLNEAVADYPDVCLTLTGEKHYYAVGEEVPELVLIRCWSLSLISLMQSHLMR